MTREERRKRRDQMVQAVKGGEPLDVICARFDVTEVTVRSACRKSSVSLPKRGRVGQLEILAQLLKGICPRVVSRSEGVSRSYVYQVLNHAKKVGIVIPPANDGPKQEG